MSEEIIDKLDITSALIRYISTADSEPAKKRATDLLNKIAGTDKVLVLRDFSQ